MELTKAVLGLRFSEAFNAWLEMRNTVRTLGENPSAEIEGAPMIMDVKDKRQRVVLHIRGLDFIQEGVNSLEDSIRVAVDKLVKLNNASKLPDINQIWYESVLIEPYALPFHELLLLMKDRLLQPNVVVDPSTDIGLIFDQTEGDVLKHFQTGPMRKKQLVEIYLAYGRDKLPDNFIFLSLRYQQNKRFAFAADDIRKFLEAAGEWQTNQAKLVFNYLQKGDD